MALEARRAGIELAPSQTPTSVATLRAPATLREITIALADVQPRVDVRETAPGVFLLSCNRVTKAAGFAAPTWLVAEIDAALRTYRHLGVIENYVLLPAGA